MANVRLLRQLVQGYKDRIDRVNSQYGEQRSIYERAVSNYNAQVGAYNEALQLPALVESLGGGRYQYRNTLGTSFNAPMVTAGDVRPSSKHRGMYDIPSAGGADYAFVDQGNGKIAIYGRSSLGYGVSETAPLVVRPSEPPAAPDIGDPGRLNLTEKEKGILQNPTLGPSEMNMTSAKGVAGTSTLAGDQPTAPTSAFANPEDPSNLKEKGVLARVLGGQL